MEPTYPAKFVQLNNYRQRPGSFLIKIPQRSSAVAYMYSGLKLGADPEEVIATAEKDNAPFTKSDELKDWVRS